MNRLYRTLLAYALVRGLWRARKPGGPHPDSLAHFDAVLKSLYREPIRRWAGLDPDALPGAGLGPLA